MSTLPLGQQLRNIKHKQLERAERVVKASLFELGANVIVSTPVDTGTARRNWMYAYGAPDDSTTESTDKSGSERQGALGRELNVLDIGDTFYMTNSLPYIERLEYEGWSEQAPVGMLRTNIANWQTIVKTNTRRQNK